MATFTDAQVAAYIRDNNLDSSGIASAASVFGLNEDQIGRAQGLLSSGSSSVNDASNAYAAAIAANPNQDAENRAFYDAQTGTGWGVPAPAPAYDYGGWQAAPAPEPYQAPTQTYAPPAPAPAPYQAPTFTDAQVAAYFRDNNLDDAGMANAANVFGVSQSQLNAAKGLLASGSSNVQAASDAYAASIAGRPDLAAQNASFFNPQTGAGWGVSNNDMNGAERWTQAQQSRWAGMDQVAVSQLGGLIDRVKAGTADPTEVGRMAAQMNLSGAQLAELVNTRMGTNYSPQQAVAFARNYTPEGVKIGANNDYILGYGGYQPVGSIYAGDNPMPPEYIQKLPEIEKSTENAVNYALTVAIEQQLRNGYDPEKSNAVQTLRGYYSDDPQLRSSAIRAASFYAVNANPNAYETFDYGYHAIVGFDKQVQAPTFKTEFDKDWSRPTLYDMINSSMGWNANNNNYADPSKRDANLNRRLTDAEIQAFQDGKLTPELASMVQRYRGGNPTGGGSSGGGAGSAGAGAGRAGGAGGTPSAPAAGAASSAGTGGAVVNRQVDARNETIEGRIQNLLATDARGNYTNPVVQQAANRALQQFSARGLLNSSIAQQAAIEAATSKAIEIAGPDAQTYFSQGRANQDAANVFERDARGYEQDQIKLDKQIDLEREKLDKQLDLERAKLTQAGSEFSKELQYKYDSFKLDTASKADAAARAQQYALEIKNIEAVNSAYDLYLRRISDIDSNQNYDAATKIQMKNAAGKDFDIYAKAKGIVWEMGLGDRFEAVPATSAPTSNTGGGMLSQAASDGGGA